jgi:DNA helicase-2/ATP-dependent DNA helicase PcrA
VVALYRRARRIVYARRTEGLEANGIEEPDLGGERLDDAVLAEALDDLGSPNLYSAEGYRRLGLFRDELRSLRDRLDQSLPDLVADVAQTIGLDVEVAVRGGANSTAGLARAHLDALGDVAARFAAETEGGTLSAFLAYLAAAEEEERGLAPGEVEVVDGAVQILTVHAAKGLEWDVVAVAGFCEDAFPAKPKSSDHWLKGMGVLPFPLRGDRDGLPSLNLLGASDGRDVRTAVEEFDAAWRAHQEREERRLAYVAVTRPRHLLLCSGFQWGNGLSEARGPSIFLSEIAAVCEEGAGTIEQWAPPPVEGDTNPTLAEEVVAPWPFDPLGPRRPAVDEGAALVRAALAGTGRIDGAGAGGLAEQWAIEADLLLAERDRERAAGTVDVVLPEHLSVSQLVALQRDPQRLARRLRRPLPEAPDPQARRGTAFHLWLEERFGQQRLIDDEELFLDDAAAEFDDNLIELKARFEAGEWGGRWPREVEVPFDTQIGDRQIRGRIDAVFADPDGGYDVVDWKTGHLPRTKQEAQAVAVQLAAYRLAWSALADVPLEKVRAAFYYVRHDRTVRPADLLDADGLTDLIAQVPVAG